MVTVPEGHRVAVVQLAQQPTFGRMESGFHVGDTGPHAGSDQVISAVAQYIAANPQAQVLLVIQPSALARELADPPTMNIWLQRLSALFAPDRPLPIMVVPQAQPGGATLACLIQSLGVCVYDSAQDGAVFVEIHTPNGMRTGLPGTLLSNDSEPTLGTIYMARRAAATSDAAAEVRDLTIRGLSVINKPPRAPAESQPQRLARRDAERGHERQHYDFSARLLAALLERTPRQNLFISPLSITIALAALANGAGRTPKRLHSPSRTARPSPAT